MPHPDRFGIPAMTEIFPIQGRLYFRGMVGAHESVDNLRTCCRHRMALSLLASGVLAELIGVHKPILAFGQDREPGLPEHILRQFLIADTADGARVARKEILHQLAAEPDCREELRADVALDNGNPALGHDLQQARFERLDQVALPLIGIQVRDRRVSVFAGNRQRQVWADRRRSETEQRGNVMRRPRFRRMHHDRRVQPEPGVIQFPHHRTQRDQAWNRRVFMAGHGVAEYDHGRPLLHGFDDLRCQPVHCRAEARHALLP